MTDALCELRQEGKGVTPQAESLAKGIREKLGDLQQAVMNSILGVDKAGLQQTAHTVQGRWVVIWKKMFFECYNFLYLLFVMNANLKICFLG